MSEDNQGSVADSTEAMSYTMPHPAPASHVTQIQGSQAVGMWRGWMSALYGLEGDVYGDIHFAARLDTLQLGPLGMTKMEAGRHRVRRTAASVVNHRTDFLKIVAPWRGTATVCQNGRQARAGCGQWLIYDTTQEYELLSPEWGEHLIITLPKRRFEGQHRAFSPLMGSYVGGSQGVSRIVLDMIRGAFIESPVIDADSVPQVTDSLAQLIELSLLEASVRTTGLSSTELLKGRIKAYVRQHLRDTGLTVDNIASALHCSRRHLYNAFSDEELSITQLIWAERVALLKQELLKPASRHRKLTDLALACGFATGAHMSRLFKQHTGVTPMQFRSDTEKPKDNPEN